MMAEARWRKSLSSGTCSSCVEVRPTRNGVQVRDSKHVEPALQFSPVGWKVFVAAVAESP
ncbi:protein of unknown function [Lentzea waywayandensis]|uniref:DUF397 domain-containing protein n=1 Tax=Lentzea waywayandensis TaxID=84724 RepID=A0A1I6DNK2_9PSEU|nr:DUF397 domain-containing protein [Lentzea waywayandensis]SFR06948.1 protein of unknown function [Lentzea waywayandensis]